MKAVCHTLKVEQINNSRNPWHELDQGSSVRALVRNSVIIAISLLPLALGLTSLVEAWRGNSAAYSKSISDALLILSAVIVVLNLYLSFVRPFLHSLHNQGSVKDMKCISGVPILGTFFATLAVILAWGECAEAVSAIVLLVGDTGGAVAFLLVVARDRSFWVNR